MLENTTSSSPLTPSSSSSSSSCHLMCSMILPYFPLASNLITGEYCACDDGGIRTQDLMRVTLLYKMGAIMAILMASALGVSLPIIGKNIPALRPESALFFLVKAFAAGVILSTGFIHILPDAFEDLTDPTLKDGPWGNFPFAGLAAMVGSLGTLMIDAFATGYYRNLHFGNGGDHHRHGGVDEEMSGDHAGHVHLHTHATHGHAHLPFGSGSGGTPPGLGNLDQIRYRITSQVLEMGIVVHSVIIGISLGTSSNLDTIKPLMAALCFHQFFEGIGLGGCIAQAAFESGSTICMALFFSLTTPLGVAVGIGITNIYDNSSPTALITQGMLNACAAGILIYMALVDLLAHDFMSYKLQANTRLFLGTNLSLLLGAGLMALLAIWA